MTRASRRQNPCFFLECRRHRSTANRAPLAAVRPRVRPDFRFRCARQPTRSPTQHRDFWVARSPLSVPGCKFKIISTLYIGCNNRAHHPPYKTSSPCALTPHLFLPIALILSFIPTDELLISFFEKWSVCLLHRTQCPLHSPSHLPRSPTPVALSTTNVLSTNPPVHHPARH